VGDINKPGGANSATVRSQTRPNQPPSPSP
jgi:hypothetical protein